MNRNHAYLFVACVAIGYCSTFTPIVFAAESDSTLEATSESSDIKSSDIKSSGTKSSLHEPAKLSVPPLDHVEYPADRPKWVSDTPQLSETNHTWVVVTPACDSMVVAEESLHELARAAVGFYVEQLTALSPETIAFPIDDEWIDRALVSKRYSGELIEGSVSRYEAAIQLRFSPEVQAEIREAAANLEVRERLGAIGLIIAGLFSALMVGSGVLGGLNRHLQKRESAQQAAAIV